MPREAKELSALEVRRLTKPGRWSVGGVGGLALQVTASGAKSWVLRMPVGGRQRGMGLGSFLAVSLADARESARAQREKRNLGTDPIAERLSATRAVAAGTKEHRRSGWCSSSSVPRTPGCTTTSRGSEKGCAE